MSRHDMDTDEQFVAAVRRVLSSLPAPLVLEADRDAVESEVVARVIAVYPHPRQRPLFGYRAIIDEYGADSPAPGAPEDGREDRIGRLGHSVQPVGGSARSVADVRLNNKTHEFTDEDEKQKYIAQRWGS